MIRKSVNSFLGFDDFSTTAFLPHHLSPFHPPSPSFTAAVKKDSAEGSVGFSDDLGLTSCTESLGFESSDETVSCFDDLHSFVKFNRLSSTKSSFDDDYCSDSSSSSSSPISSFELPKQCPSRRMTDQNKNKQFPPPLTSLSDNGRRNFTLKSVRKDGRLEIVEVKIGRPEILCASRQNGRLTLHLVKTIPEDEDDLEEEEEEETEEDKEREITEEEKETEWPVRSPATGVRRCYDHMWGKQQQHKCVTTI